MFVLWLRARGCKIKVIRVPGGNPLLETPRLHLIPLTAFELAVGLESIDSLSRLLNIPLDPELYAGRARNAVEMKVNRMQGKAEQELTWYTYWLIHLREENRGVGLVGFKGIPNEKGEVEIGYGIAPSYQGRGYMTEAVKALTAWAFSHPECKAITAPLVKPENFGSQHVLEKSGFRRVYSGPDGVSYRLDRKNHDQGSAKR